MREKRRFVRVKALDSASYKIKGEDTVYKAQVKDLSIIGINIFTEEIIDKGIILELELILPNLPDPVYVDGEVVWHLNAHDDCFAVGIHFINLDIQVRDQLSQLIFDYAKRINENREFVRANLKAKAVYSLIDDITKKNDAAIIDISCGGMKLAFNKNVSLDDLLKISFNLPADERIIEFVGKVVWVKQQADDCFEIGVNFIRINEPDKERIREFIIKTCKEERG